MSTAAMPQRRRRYTSREQVEAIRLREEGEWSVAEIARIMRRRGFDVSEGAVRMWVDPEHAERQRDRDRQYRRRQRAARSEGRLRGNHSTPEMRAARVRALRVAGLSHSAIVKVMTLDFPEHPLTVDQVRYQLGEDRGRAAA